MRGWVDRKDEIQRFFATFRMTSTSQLEAIHPVKQRVADPDQGYGESGSRKHHRFRRAADATARLPLCDWLQGWLQHWPGGSDRLLRWVDLPGARMDQMNSGTSRICGVRHSQCVFVSHPRAPHSPEPRVGIEGDSRYPTKEPWRQGDGAIWPEVSRMVR